MCVYPYIHIIYIDTHTHTDTYIHTNIPTYPHTHTHTCICRVAPRAPSLPHDYGSDTASRASVLYAVHVKRPCIAADDGRASERAQARAPLYTATRTPPDFEGGRRHGRCSDAMKPTGQCRLYSAPARCSRVAAALQPRCSRVVPLRGSRRPMSSAPESSASPPPRRSARTPPTIRTLWSAPASPTRGALQGYQTQRHRGSPCDSQRQRSRADPRPTCASERGSGRAQGFDSVGQRSEGPSSATPRDRDKVLRQRPMLAGWTMLRTLDRAVVGVGRTAHAMENKPATAPGAWSRAGCSYPTVAVQQYNLPTNAPTALLCC
jgi:hypothetical protein